MVPVRKDFTVPQYTAYEENIKEGFEQSVIQLYIQMYTTQAKNAQNWKTGMIAPKPCS